MRSGVAELFARSAMWGALIGAALGGVYGLIIGTVALDTFNPILGVVGMGLGAAIGGGIGAGFGVLDSPLVILAVSRGLPRRSISLTTGAVSAAWGAAVAATGSLPEAIGASILFGIVGAVAGPLAAYGWPR